MTPKQIDRGTAEGVGTIFALVTLLLFVALAIPALGSLTVASTISAERQLAFQGQLLASELQTVDQLVRASSSDGTIGRRIALSEHIGNDPYTISIGYGGTSGSYLDLRTNSGSVSVRVVFVSETPVTNTTVRGGPLSIVREDGEPTIRVEELP